MPAQFTEQFAIPPSSSAARTTPLAIVRTGLNDSPSAASLQYLYTLKEGPVAWLGTTDPTEFPSPEIILTQRAPDGSGTTWPFLRRLLDAETFAPAFTLDAGRYSAIARLQEPPDPLTGVARSSIVHDYDGANGETIRFGDGTFGQLPLPDSRFEIIYRVGAGASGNVPADAVNRVDPTIVQVVRVSNPFPATGGSDAEDLDRVRRRAPEQFRATQYRAVLPEDYAAAAETLPWVQRAGTSFKWTGSWLTVFTTADPLSSEQITIDERTELIDLLNRYRMAGYESYVPEAEYVSLDVIVELCALPTAFRAEVEENVLAQLTSPALPDGTKGFFQPDNFTFGQPLDRSRLEAAIQNAAGVAGVICVAFRVRGRAAGFADMPEEVAVGPDQIIRCDNDRSFPEHGSLKIIVEGGK
jgi:predicted phage baseplate assembly protein